MRLIYGSLGMTPLRIIKSVFKAGMNDFLRPIIGSFQVTNGSFVLHNELLVFENTFGMLYEGSIKKFWTVFVEHNFLSFYIVKLWRSRALAHRLETTRQDENYKYINCASHSHDMIITVVPSRFIMNYLFLKMHSECFTLSCSKKSLGILREHYFLQFYLVK